MSERAIQAAILDAYGSDPRLRFWRQNAGLAWAGDVVHRTPSEVILRNPRPFRAGVPGLPDIVGVLRGGRFLGVEVKSERGRQQPEQRAFQAMLEGFGGLYALVRSPEEFGAIVTGS